MRSSNGLRAETPTKVEVELPAGRDAPARARLLLEELKGVDEETLADARLVLSELVANSVRHAGLGPDDHIRVEVDEQPDVVRIHVVDPGPGFEPHVTHQRSLRASRWGLFLVDQIASRWGIATKGQTTVWCEIALR